MILLLDSNKKFTDDAIAAWPGVEFGQLKTPLTAYKRNGLYPWALDNGCFTEFNYAVWKKQLVEAREDKATFVTLPDVVGSARRTLELFSIFSSDTAGLKRALVLQDGIGDFSIPWDVIDAVFVGGSDEFKESNEAMHACKAAKILGKWVHVGRVNTPGRVSHWFGVADSIDGSGISRFSDTLRRVCVELTGMQHKKEQNMDWFTGEEDESNR